MIPDDGVPLINLTRINVANDQASNNEVPDADNISFLWDNNSNGMCNFPFSRRNELLVPLPGDKPIDYFRLLLDDDFLNLIVEQTNIYAQEVFCQPGISEKSRIVRWKPLSAVELLTFLGLVLHTGTIKLNKIQDYWKVHPLFNFKCFSSHMSRDRFLLIMRCLHFAKNPTEGQTTDDRLYKVSPILNFFNQKMAEVYYPGKQLSLDESMVLWRGRLLFRQYIKNKQHKYGLKLYMLSEPNGIIVNIAVYTGVLDSKGGKGHAANVVLHLMEGKLNCGHSLFMDNFYNSCGLAETLLKKQTYCTGTLRADRKYNPKEVVKAKLEKGETVAKYSKKIMVGKWKDRRDVLYISTEFENEMVEYTDKINRTRLKPLPILEYNEYMGGVDRQDQMTSYYPCERKTLRWYKKLGLHIIQLMLLNAYYLHGKYSSQQKMSLYHFRLAVIEELLGIEKKATLDSKATTVVSHHPTKIPDVSTKNETKRKRCRVCSQNKIRKSTIYHCEKCPDMPGLCPGNCFVIYHAK